MKSAPGYVLDVARLDASGRRLVAMSATPGTGGAELAVVALNDSAVSQLGEAISTFASSGGRTGRGRGQITKSEAGFIANTDDIALATLREIWRGHGALPTDSRWWQVWLERSVLHDEEPLAVLRRLGPELGLVVPPTTLTFTRRAVVHVKGTAAQLSGLVGSNAMPVEIRPTPSPEPFVEAPFTLQEELVEDFMNRVVPSAASDVPVVTVLDAGVLAGHPLLAHSLSQSLTLHSDGAATSDFNGHGTSMAGLALYGNLTGPLNADLTVDLRHRIESVRILGLDGDRNSAGEYGTVMAEAVARVEIEAPTTRRVFSMSVTDHTEEPAVWAGEPTAWSTTVDALAFGHDVSVTADGNVELLTVAQPGPSRLFLISAGNVRKDHGHDHLTRSDLMPVEDPAQSWNAITVGAYTDLAHHPENGSAHSGWRPLAVGGELSPFSRTGVPLDARWPNKPDIVMEGGNLLAQAGPDGELDTECRPSHGVLTTSRGPFPLVHAVHATSPATAAAARLAALVMDRYPNLGAEAVRGLLVHCSEWTPAMWQRFEAADAFKTKGVKTDVGALLRRYGWGVPAEDRLLNSSAHDLTLIADEEFLPLQKDKGKKLSLAHMRVHELPWPIDVLRSMGKERVRLRVTLSYFVEPWVGGQGWRDRFVYPSHELRFDLPRTGEAVDDFQLRVSHDAAADGAHTARAGRKGKPKADSGWLLGPKQRQRGSLCSDMWEGSASDLADRGCVAVYPAGGWWTRQDMAARADRPVRYALLITVRSSEVETDLLTPIISEIRTRTAVAVSV
ncbi:S8 family peptidase [Nocardia sp. NPDC058705]|uniref:S8 family peptidase n=1 Tax=Nocardia sp. NPDC058705 TaxID=3346609 RepID=UPI003688C79E